MTSDYEPMEVDEVPGGWENKENLFRNNGPKTPSDMGCEDLDASEMNMKLRLSCTPLVSPTPKKHFTGASKKQLFTGSGDNESIDQTLTNNSDVTMMEWSIGDHNANVSTSELDSTKLVLQSEDANNTLLQSHSEMTFPDDSVKNNNATTVVSSTFTCEASSNGSDTKLIAPMSTPVKEIPVPSTSPIMRGLKSVLSMFRPSQSPIAPSDADLASLDDRNADSDINMNNHTSHPNNVSTPVQHNKDKITPDLSSIKANSSLNRDSLVFNEDLINDLQWSDDSTIIFNKDKFPGHKINAPCTQETKPMESDVKVCENKTFNVELKDKLDTIDCLESKEKYNNSYKTESETNIIINDIVKNILEEVFEKAEEVINNQEIKSVVIGDKEYNCNADSTSNDKQEHVGSACAEAETVINCSIISSADIISEKISIECITDSENNVIAKQEKLDRALIPAETKTTSLIEHCPSKCSDDSGHIFSDGVLNESDKKEVDLRNECKSLNNALLENPIDANISAHTARSEINFDEIQNPFVSRPRVSTSPAKTTAFSAPANTENEIPLIESTEVIENKNQKPLNENNETNEIPLIESTEVIENKNQKPLNENNETNEITCLPSEPINQSLKTENAKHTETAIQDICLALESISNCSPRSCDNLNPENQEQSDAYLSADSGRESEQLLDNEVEMIHHQSKSNAFESQCASSKEDLSIDKINTESHIISEKTFSINPEYSDSLKINNKTTSCGDSSTYDLENPFATKVKLRMSPTIETEKSFSVQESPFTTKSKLRMSPTQNSTFDKPHESFADTPTNLNEESFVNEVSNNMTITKLSTEFESIKISEKVCETPTKANVSQSKELSNVGNVDGTFIIEQDGKAGSMEESPFATKSKLRMSPISNLTFTKCDEISTDQCVFQSQENLDNKVTNSVAILKSSTTLELDNKSVKDGDLEVNSKQSAEAKVSQLKTGIEPSNEHVDKTFVIEENSGEISNITVDDNPFATKSKIRMSPTNSLSENKHNGQNTNSNLTFVMNDECANNDDSRPEQNYENESSSSGNNTTIREVITEDEDTIEGPEFFDLKQDIEDPFESKSKILSEFAEKMSEKSKGPKLIKCSDITSKDSVIDDLTSEDEFMECVDEEFKPGEMFINADAFDFLMNQNAAPSGQDNGKESLFLKFDPLCAKKRQSAGPSADIHPKLNSLFNTTNEIISEEVPISNNYTLTSNRLDQTYTQTLTPTPENTDSGKELHVPLITSSSTPEKPTMVVIPAISSEPVNNTRNSYTPTRTERRSITFSSPAIAAIDRLISLNSSGGQSYYTEHVGSSQETREAVLQLQDMLTEKEIEVNELKRESLQLQDRLTDLQVQMKNLIEDNEERKKRIDELKVKLAHKSAMNKNMTSVVEEYERTIAGMIAENENEKQKHEKEKNDLIRERDEQIAHLNSMEVSFNDLHTKYEKAKQLILTFKSNEEALRKTIEEFKEREASQERNFETLKEKALQELNTANTEFEKMKRTHDAEVVKLTAQLKRKELHISSLEESVAQKAKENEDLTAICDELISKVS